MPLLTPEAIRANPWNAVTHRLPFFPGRLLLGTAHLAAEYCYRLELEFIRAIARGAYGAGDSRLAKTLNARCREAYAQAVKISDAHCSHFGEPLDDYDRWS